MMSIQVRVISAQASRDVKRLEAQLAMLQKQTMAAGAASAMVPGRGSFQAFTKWGNQVQWAGRQLQYNFTLPILLAGGAAAKFALDNEKAMVRVVKVYGDGTMSAGQLKSETDALGRSFEALSNKFGVAQADAINIAADWAAAGASGVALAKSVGLTMETMILGEMEAGEATQALIAIQAQYGQSIEELSATIDTLNMIENQTGISMAGLVQGFSRAAGVARTAGVTVRELGAMMAALVPASGSAANAGNALKTMLSRLMSPTKEADQVFQEMGIATKELGWQSLTATQRLEAMAKKFDKLSDAQKVVVSTVAASRWQINRFDTLMRDILNPMGYYQKALSATESAQANFNQRQKELNAVLNSNPQRLKQIWTILQNAMADVVQPMIPMIVSLAGAATKLFQAFQELDPSIQKLAMVSLLLLAAVGPLARYIGAVSVLIGGLHAAFAGTIGVMVKFGKYVGGALVSPFKEAGTAIGAAIGKLKSLGPFLAKQVARMGLGGAGASMGASLVAGLMGAFRALPAIMGTAFKGIFGIQRLGIMMTMIAFIKTTWIKAFTSWTGAVRAIFVRFWTLLPVAMVSATGRMRAIWALFGATFNAIWMATTIAFTRAWRLTVVAFQAGLALMRGATVVTATSIPLIAAATVRSTAVVVASSGAMVRVFGAVGAAAAALPKIIAFSLVAVSRIPAMVAAAFAAVTTILAAAGPVILAVITSPWTIAALAVLGILYAFRDDIANIWNEVVFQFYQMSGPLETVVGWFDGAVNAIESAFWRLPSGVRDAILTVVKIVHTAAMKVYELFSYLNPFAHHSPSLVEQVTAGMAEIKRQYASVGNVGAAFSKAARDLAAYKNAVAGLGGGEFDDERVEVGKSYPKLLSIFDALKADLAVMNNLLAAQYRQVQAQQIVVDAWAAALDRANAALDAEQGKLDSLQSKLDSLNDAYAAHQQAVSNYANAPLAGMGKMEDQIFANEMAQKKLRLEIMKWEQANGSIEDVKNNMAGLTGSIESLRAEAKTLQMAGAGSDILGPINKQIADMEAAYQSMGNAANNSPVNAMQKQLEELQRKGEMMDLEKAIKFDPMIREIDKLANAQKELSYNEIVAGIKAEQAAMAALGPQIAAATAAVAAQQAAVDKATAARDQIQAAYDAESAKLDMLQDAYSKTEDTVRELESALNDMGRTASARLQEMEQAANKAAQAAKSAAGYVSPGLENFRNAEGGNYPDPGGFAKIGREGTDGDQTGLIDQYTKDITDDVSKMFGDIDMLKPIKDMWNKAWKWVEDNVWPTISGIWTGITSAWGDGAKSLGESEFTKNIKEGWEDLKSVGSTVWGFIGRLINLFKDDFALIMDKIVEAGKKIWTEIGPELEQFKELWPGIREIFGGIGDILKVVGAIIGVVVVGAFKILTSILAHTLGPALDIIIGVFKGLVEVVRGVAEIIVGIFTGDFSKIVDGVKSIFSGVITAIWSIIKGGWNLIWGAVEGLINGVIDWFVWLYDELVGHSIIPDMIRDIVAWFAGMPKKVIDAVWSLVQKMVNFAVEMWTNFSTKSSKKWGEFVAWLTGLPKKAYDSLSDLKTKWTTISSEAWENFKAKSSAKWGNFIYWLKGLGKNAYDNLADIKTKWTNIASEAWANFRKSSGTKWGEFIKWLSERPANAYNNLIGIKDKMIAVAKAAFQALKNEASRIVDGKGGFMGWIGGLPGRIANALGGVGGAVANAVKGSWNGAAKWLNDNAIGAINSVTGKFGFSMPRLPSFEGGGVIPGKISKRDNTIIAARTGEGVIVPELVRALGGARGLDEANAAAKRGNGSLASLGIERFANGGIIGKVAGWLQSGAGNALGNVFDGAATGLRKLIHGKPFFEDYSAGNINNAAKKARQWGDNQDTIGNPGGPPGTVGRGWRWQQEVLRDKFPQARVTSAYRPGAMTATGAISYHSLGRAIDIIPTSQNIYDWLYNTYGKASQQLIWSPMGVKGKNIHAGRDYRPSATTLADHWDHIHWGYDKGGILPPGLTMAYNGTGKDEVTLTNGDWQTFSNVVSLMDRVGQKSTSAGTPGAGMVARTMATVTSLEARLRAAETRSTTQTRSQGGDHIENHFHGDLSFPNVRDGSDAEDFLNHLKGLAG